MSFFIDSSVREVPFTSRGDGPPLLMLAGFAQSARIWDGILPRFTSHFNCLTFDNRGVGTRAEEVAETSLDALADDAAAVINAAGAGPAAVLGWSMGGAIAQKLAHRHPDLVTSLVLLSTMARRTSVQEQWMEVRIGISESGVDRVAAELAVLPWLFTSSLLANPDRTMALARANASILGATPEGMRSQATALVDFDARSFLPEIDVPTLVVVGAEDVLTPVQEAVVIVNSLPRAELAVLPRGGHSMILESPAETVPLILRFLRNQETSSKPRGRAIVSSANSTPTDHGAKSREETE